jgi:hypothetical protein
MLRKIKKGGNAAIRKAAGPMKNKQDKRMKQALDREVQRQLEEYDMKRKG